MTTLVPAAIDSLRSQNTIAEEATVTGFGYWNNQDVSVTFRPAAEHSGITFVREDLDPEVRIPARVEHRLESPRRTVLSYGGATVEMIEHVMAALAGTQVDNCEVWLNGPEVPGCDGSSLPFVEALRATGIEPQVAERPALIITDKTRVGDEEAWIVAKPLPAKAEHRLLLQYRLDYGINHIIGRQTYRIPFDAPRFCEEVAPARTYLMKEEADWLRQQGLGQRTTYQDLLVFQDPEGVIDNELRFEDECARHKMLDMVGDLSLAGCDLVGDIAAYRSGHRLNAHLAKALLAEGQIIDTLRTPV